MYDTKCIYIYRLSFDIHKSTYPHSVCMCLGGGHVAYTQANTHICVYTHTYILPHTCTNLFNYIHSIYRMFTWQYNLFDLFAHTSLSIEIYIYIYIYIKVFNPVLSLCYYYNYY